MSNTQEIDVVSLKQSTEPTPRPKTGGTFQRSQRLLNSANRPRNIDA